MSAPEELLAIQLRATGIKYVREYRFAPPRRWRADYRIDPDVLVEVEGGLWTGGAHARPKGIIRDIEKANEAVLMGYRLLRVTPDMIKDGTALALIERAIA